MAVKKIEYLRKARDDFDQSFDWYAERSAEAAIGFAVAVDDAIDRVLEDPSRFPTLSGSCAYCSLRRYPFRLVFRDEPNRLIVIAIAHAKRRPNFWQDRT